jgi:sugar phosphate isomerase/epimerase
MVKFGIMTRAGADMRLHREKWHHLKKLGYDCIDASYSVTNTPIYQADNASLESFLSELRGAIEEAGLSVSQTHGPWRFPPMDATEEQRAERFEKMTKGITITRLLGCKYMVIHPLMPYGYDKDPNKEEFYRINFEFFNKLIKVCEENDVVICLENMPMPLLSISSPQAVLDFVKEINSPYMGICLDTGHSSVLKVSPGDAVRTIGKKYLKVLHIHDNMGRQDQHLPPFKGVIDWEDFSKALKEIEFEGCLSVETTPQSFDPSLTGEELLKAEQQLIKDLHKIASFSDIK